MMIALEGFLQARISILPRLLLAGAGIALLLVQSPELRLLSGAFTLLLLAGTVFTPRPLHFVFAKPASRKG